MPGRSNTGERPRPGSSPAAPRATVDVLVGNALTALQTYGSFTQERVDHIVRKASLAALAAHTRLAVLAVKETGRGVFEDKAVKDTVRTGVELMRGFEPDTIVALGGGSPMDAAKVMWLMYEHPDVEFADLKEKFIDIRKRAFTFPDLGEKAIVCVPTTSGTGSEVTPFSVITDTATGQCAPANPRLRMLADMGQLMRQAYYGDQA